MTKCERPEGLVCISCVDEVRYSFVSHLSTVLRRKGLDSVVVDVDSDDLFSKESQAKFEKARVSVMVLPGNSEPTRVYLDKFERILECQRNKDHVVVPVLYGDSLLQGGEWLHVLDLRGLSPIHQSRRECSDSKLVEEIVKDVYEKLFYMGRPGLYSKILDIENMVNKQPIGIRCVGIWGMPGIGKTTLAKAVFDHMFGNFDAYCFIEDYDKAIHEKGLYRLLGEQLLNENLATGSILMSLSFLKKILSTKGVLVVLDDVCNALAAESFLEEFDWFGPESLIIITSRDKQVFGLCRINHIYEVQGLNENEALQVFMLCASIKEMGEQNLRELSMEIIKYADGNPLALSIFGRELKCYRGQSEIVHAFLQLIKRRPLLEIFDAIKDIYETLSNNEKNIFLDIACFFSGENVDYVTQLLEGCGFFPHVGVDVLVEKCLVTISENKVRMHNVIQEFGRELVNGETAEVERRSRLWEPCSIRDLLEDNGQKDNGEHKTTFNCVQGTEEIEGMFLDTLNLSFDVKPAAFENMLNLRLLKIYCSNPKIYTVIHFPKGSLHSLPNELRLLHWENYPLKSLPQNFDPRHLVELNMQYSQLQTLESGTKNLEMLRTIRLCHSQKLFNIDDLQNAQNIEVIDLQGCTKLQSFPATSEMLHLRVLNLSGCTEIKSLSEIPPNIEMLHLQGTGIKELPLSIVKPNYSEILNHLAKIPGLSGVSNLKESDLEFLTTSMNMSTSRLDLGKLICLELKDCSRLQSLPDMVDLDLLRGLDLSDCSELQTIQGFPRNLKELIIAGTAVRQVPQLPQSLELFNANGCVLLQSIGLDFKKLPVHYTFSNCFDLSPEVLNDFLVKALANVKHIPREREQGLNEAPAFRFCAPSHRKIYSTLHLQPGSSVMIRLDNSLRKLFVGFAMLVEVAFWEDNCDDTGFDIICVCRWRNKEGHSHVIERNLHCWAPGKAVTKIKKSHIFVFVDINMRPGIDEGNVTNIWGDLVVFEFFLVNKQKKPLDDSCRVTRCGVRVINAASGNTSLENILPVLSMDPNPMKVSDNEVIDPFSFSDNYDGLEEKDKDRFLYIACLFNNEDVGLVAPLIASNMDLDVSSGLKVLADRSLISLSSNGEIVMHSFQRQMGKKLLHGQSIEKLVDYSQSSMLTQLKNPGNWTRNLFDVPERKSSLMDASSVVRPPPRRVQVFICFCGKDVGNNFIRFLDQALREANIKVFTNDEFLGSDLVQIWKMIEESDIALVIFSEDFTSSYWCLDELAKIKECMDKGTLIGFPIFYRLETSEVKYLEGHFGDNFRKLKRSVQHDRKRTEKWEEALTSMPDLLSMTLSEISDKTDKEFIESIVDIVMGVVDIIEMRENVDQEREEVNSQFSEETEISYSNWTWSSTDESLKFESSNLLPTMASRTGKKIRFVKCPKCFKILQEDEDVPVYRCGSCSTICQAKKRNIAPNITPIAEETEFSAGEASVDLSSFTQLMESQSGGINGRFESSNLLPTMASRTGKKIRLVKCRKCFKILQEDEDVPVYQCGSCLAIYQAKKRNIAPNITPIAEETEISAEEASVDLSSFTQLMESQSGGINGRFESSNLLPTMASRTGKKIRLVKCRKCFKILQEDEDVPVYQCGSCLAIYQVKKRNIAPNITPIAEETEFSAGEASVDL